MRARAHDAIMTEWAARPVTAAAGRVKIGTKAAQPMGCSLMVALKVTRGAVRMAASFAVKAFARRLRARNVAISLKDGACARNTLGEGTAKGKRRVSAALAGRGFATQECFAAQAARAMCAKVAHLNEFSILAPAYAR